MDFNKEEAVRARGIAEENIRNNDYGAARRLALRAKKLDSQLGNLDQICSVCDVHYAGENKINGKDMDWYVRLQIKLTDDESLIKKQYHKLALLLHTDKNKYPGAEAAFKLIGEAKMVLLDRQKRQLHDSVRANTASANEKPCTDRTPPASTYSACCTNEKPCSDKNPLAPVNTAEQRKTK